MSAVLTVDSPMPQGSVIKPGTYLATKFLCLTRAGPHSTVGVTV